MRARLSLALGALLILALAAAGGWRLGRGEAMEEMTAQGTAVLELAVDRLVGQLDRYRDLPGVLARHPVLLAALAPDGPRAQANTLLADLAEQTGALDIYVMDATGLTVASSNASLERSFVGRRFSWRPYFVQARAGGRGFYHAVGTTSDQRGFYYSAPIGASGVIAVKVDLDTLEGRWRGFRDTVFFTDAAGVVFLSNRQSLILRSLGVPPVRAALADPMQYARREIVPLDVQNGPIWVDPGLEHGPARAIWLRQEVPEIGMTAHVLRAAAGIERQGIEAGLLAGGAATLMMLGAGALWQRRRALALRLSLEEQATARLEGEVAVRTGELRRANAALERENAVRRAAEDKLRRAQEELVQAVKLRALGEMSAGISHELNQPLATIQTLAENGQILLSRGRSNAVGENLGRIQSSAERMAEIVRTLRGFVQQEAGEPLSDVDLGDPIRDALSLVEARRVETGAVIEWTPPSPPLLVRGGRVRLGQVVLNLISNALDAMAEGPAPRRVDLSVARDGAAVRLTVADTGPGIAVPERVFDPFYTTKPGAGLGLGLSISFAIVRSFGGHIRAGRAPEGGGAFTVELVAAEAEEVALA